MDAVQLREILTPPTTSVEKAGKVLNLSRAAAYEAVHRGDIQTIRMGRKILVLTVPLRKLLGLDAA